MSWRFDGQTGKGASLRLTFFGGEDGLVVSLIGGRNALRRVQAARQRGLPCRSIPNKGTADSFCPLTTDAKKD